MNANKEQYNAKMREYMWQRRTNRLEALRRQLGGECSQCGAKENLEFDHVDPDLKVLEVSNPRLLDGSWANLLAEVAKCQLLCKPCHVDRTRSQQALQVHGTYWSYQKYKCRCPECKVAYSVKNKQYKEASRRKREAKAMVHSQVGTAPNC